jgi:hypothetical protein
VLGHCTCFLIYNWPLLCYLGNEMDCCSVDHSWLLSTEQQWLPCDWRASFKKGGILRLDHWCTYHSFSEDVTYAVVFRNIVSVNYWHWIKIVRAVFENITILFFGNSCEGLLFLFIFTEWQTNRWHAKNQFFIMGGLKMCKPVRISCICFFLKEYIQSQLFVYMFM